jgi:hypothetical protein
MKDCPLTRPSGGDRQARGELAPGRHGADKGLVNVERGAKNIEGVKNGEAALLVRPQIGDQQRPGRVE